MARSHHRPKKHHQQQHAVSAKTRKKGVTVITIFIAVFGLLMGYLVGGGDVVYIVLGLLGGVLVGYIVGRSVDNAKTK